jgi:hypothetical protein
MLVAMDCFIDGRAPGHRPEEGMKPASAFRETLLTFPRTKLVYVIFKTWFLTPTKCTSPNKYLTNFKNNFFIFFVNQMKPTNGLRATYGAVYLKAGGIYHLQ